MPGVAPPIDLPATLTRIGVERPLQYRREVHINEGGGVRGDGRVVDLAVVMPRSREATVEVLHEHGPMLLAAARVITLDDEEARDLVQTTFEIALRRIDSLREPTALRAWLLRIETREAFRVVRRLRRIVSLEGHVHQLASPSGPVGQRAEIREALLTLPARIRAAVVLHYLAGLSVRETAEAMGVSENTIKSQLKTGLARLREVLDGE